jgi:hypothetical protein
MAKRDPSKSRKLPVVDTAAHDAENGEQGRQQA